MATANFQNGYVNTGTDLTTPLYPENTEPGFTFDFDTELVKGDVVTINYPNLSTENLEYFGLSEDGDPGFVQVGQSATATNATKFFTDQTLGFTGAFPDFDSTEPFVCFLPGTLIATPDGEMPVEALSIGDLVLTADGRAVPVKWIGMQTVFARFGMPEGRRPVRISAGALGGKLPVRDLLVTSDHALLVDDVLVHAGALVNGTTIRRMTLDEIEHRLTVYHIETENHEVILAEGQPAETFIDNVDRAHFDNYAEYEAIYGPAPKSMAELEQPRAMSHRQVPPDIRKRIGEAATKLSRLGTAA